MGLGPNAFKFNQQNFRSTNALKTPIKALKVSKKSPQKRKISFDKGFGSRGLKHFVSSTVSSVCAFLSLTDKWLDREKKTL